MIFGLDVAEAVFRRLDPQVSMAAGGPRASGSTEPPATVVELEGDARALLTGERMALNFLAHLSGDRDRDRALRPGSSREPAWRCSTRARRPPACARSRSRRSRRAAVATTAWGSTTRSS